MTRRAPPRKSLRDQQRENAQAMNYYAALSGKPAIPVPEGSKKRGPRIHNPADEPLEGAEQSAVISWWFSYSRTIQCDHRLLLSIPNAQKLMAFATNRHAFMQSLRNEGFRDGAPDLLLLVPRGEYHGMAIEMKRRTKGFISEAQMEMLYAIGDAGYLAVIAWGADNAIRQIKEYLK